MYLDYILFAVGGILLCIAIVLSIKLFLTRKQSREYHRIMQKETERIDVMDTLRSTQQTLTGNKISTGRQEKTTEVITEVLEEVTAAEKENALDISPLKDKYELLREFKGGGMSRTFLAKNLKLGNEWLIKFVDKQYVELVDEAEVLKKLNHISLPQIIDIFQNKEGTFLVERYIDGYSMDHVMGLKQEIKESMICDWGIQLAQVLRYLHNLETPIIHCDLKPSNIMITHDNRLMLIDFGVSKRQGIDEKSAGFTYQYAAPEQFRGKTKEFIEGRFGVLPETSAEWEVDERTDLYSLGVILYELIMGEVPASGDAGKIYSKAAPQLADIINKCLQLDPKERYQSAKELEEALEGIKQQRLTMAKSLVLRRVAGICCALCFVGGFATTASAMHIYRMENLAVISMDPGTAVVTEQQSVQILVEKTKADGETVFMEPNQVQWSYSEDNIARLDGDRLVGLNVGETILYGKYRNKVFALEVTVTEPVEESVTVALRYPEGTSVDVYAGNGEREIKDGVLSECAFVSPESMSVDGITLWVSDSGVIRYLEEGEAYTMYLEPDFLTADIVRGWEEALYVLTGPWEDETGSYYGFLRITADGAEFLYYTEAAWSTITDFTFSPDGTLWFIQQNLGTGITTLNTLDVNTLETAWVMDLPDSACGMTFDENETLYISVPEDGVILRVEKDAKEWTYFAGVEGERNFIDGAIPNFYHPTSLAVEGDALYVLDFDTVRKITVAGEGALFTETLVGVPTENTNPSVVLEEGSKTILPASE